MRKVRLRATSGSFPGKGGTQHDALVAGNASATIPLGSFTFTASKDGGSYTDVIVGQNPFQRGHSATTVKILLIPVIVNIGANVFDPTAPNTCGGSLGNSDMANFQNSPILSQVTFDGAGGATQTFTAAQTAGNSAFLDGTPGTCNGLGGLEINHFDPIFQNMIATWEEIRPAL